jgi:hypothetical protein
MVAGGEGTGHGDRLRHERQDRSRCQRGRSSPETGSGFARAKGGRLGLPDCEDSPATLRSRLRGTWDQGLVAPSATAPVSDGASRGSRTASNVSSGVEPITGSGGAAPRQRSTALHPL